MKLALVLVAVVLVVNAEGWGWRAPRVSWPRIRIPRIGIPPVTIPGIRITRDVREAEGDAAFNAAAEDGVLSDDEIKSVLGVADKDLAGFKVLYDVNSDGKITVEEYRAVTATLANAGDKEN
ncbi:hypothetical protein LOTGIDRAFT_230732 [Lottia gigantea]|uniref:EF-hand domain-containing protein n=1 Tax=Lottia gigantea TaxID=225164 RepID=V4A945_LOTGI|nr:hypothetical protein LOTGIDRAFT_230732 [Lottia gigantea]ESP00484.1 hypothetical protein LOTGIDRAFT_230732 [Lottia gigantea]